MFEFALKIADVFRLDKGLIEGSLLLNTKGGPNNSSPSSDSSDSSDAPPVNVFKEFLKGVEERRSSEKTLPEDSLGESLEKMEEATVEVQGFSFLIVMLWKLYS